MNSNEQTRKIKVINRRIKQIETRIQREVILEDGKVIQDTGPKITTKTIEDYDTKEIEESEDVQNHSKSSKYKSSSSSPLSSASSSSSSSSSSTSSPIKQYFFGESPSHYTINTKSQNMFKINKQNADNTKFFDTNNNIIVENEKIFISEEKDRQLPIEFSNFTKIFHRS